MKTVRYQVFFNFIISVRADRIDPVASRTGVLACLAA